MGEPIVTIKFTESEVKNLLYTVDRYIENKKREHTSGVNVPDVKPVYYKLKNDLKKIGKWINEEKHKAEVDKRISKESTEEQTEVETHQRICVPCDD